MNGIGWIDGMTKPRALITGITGMVGSHLAEFLIEHLEPGSRVVALRILPGVDVLEQGLD